MGAIQSRKKYIILYGPLGSGKSTLLFSQKSTTKLFEPMEPTKGLNYEELTVDNQTLGIFEVSGDKKQYQLLNIIASSVLISGLIYVVSLYDIENLRDAKDQLKLLLGNTYLDEDSIALFVIYNIRQNDKERLSWLTADTLDDGLDLNKMKEKFRLKLVFSLIHDCSSNNKDIFDEQSLIRKMKPFIDLLFKE